MSKRVELGPKAGVQWLNPRMRNLRPHEHLIVVRITIFVTQFRVQYRVKTKHYDKQVLKSLCS